MNEEKALSTKQQDKNLKTILNMPDIQKRFQETLNSNPGSFIAAILNAAVINPEINQCEPWSVVNAALQAASLGLSISPALGQAAIIPFNSKEGKKAQFQIMKNGLVQLALRTNQYRFIHVADIYEGETMEEDRLTGQMKLGGRRTSKKVIGKVGYFKLLNGFEKYLVMMFEEVMDHATRYSKSWDKQGQCFRKGTPWDNNFDKMWEKTVLKLLLKGYGVLSDKMQTAFEVENETGEIEAGHEQVETFDAELFEANIPEEQPKRTVKENLAQLGFDEAEVEEELNYSGA